LCEECPVKISKKKSSVKITQTTVNRVKFIEKLTTEEYKKYMRKRNGVEGVMSVLRRRYHVDDMPVRGLVRSKMWFGFKIGAINIKRAIAYIAKSSFSTNISNFALVCDRLRLYVSFLLHNVGVLRFAGA
jgi:hypothetical protein